MVCSEIDNWIRTQLFDEMPASCCVIDRDFQIIMANRVFTETYGAWEGRHCYAVYKGRDSICTNCAAASCFRDGCVRSRQEQGHIGGDESIHHYYVHMMPIVRSNGEIPYVVEMSRDITAVKILEEQKREAEHLAAVGETVAGIAHGMKNVLMALEGGMYGVTTGIEQGDDARVAQGWKILEENVARLTRFTKEFLDFARGRVAEVSLVDPNRLAENAAEQFREQASRAGIELKVNLQKGIQPAPMDREGIHSCLVNLLSNAIDACQMSDRDRSFVVIVSTRERDGVLSFEVSDNGCGIEYELSKKIFTSFVSGKGADKGTGLGLLTTKKIVHQHGGRVSFESEKGEGSMFRVQLPRNSLPLPPECRDESGPNGNHGRDPGWKTT
jgi:signal transduction histidine kinase